MTYSLDTRRGIRVTVTYIDDLSRLTFDVVHRVLKELDALLNVSELMAGQSAIIEGETAVGREQTLKPYGYSRRTTEYEITRINYNSPLVITITTGATTVVGFLSASFRWFEKARLVHAKTNADVRAEKLRLEVIDALYVSVLENNTDVQVDTKVKKEVLEDLTRLAANSLFDMATLQTDPPIEWDDEEEEQPS